MTRKTTATNRYLTIPVILAALLLGILPLDTANCGDDLTSDERLREHGWTIDIFSLGEGDRSGVQRVFAQGRLQCPAPSIWTVIHGARDSGQWPSVKESVLESYEGNTEIRRYELSIPVYPDRRYKLLTINHDDLMFQEFSMVPGYGNVREIKGSWTVIPLADSLSLVEYRLDTDPGTRFIPGFIVKWATKKAIPRSFAYLHQVACRNQQHTMKLEE